MAYGADAVYAGAAGFSMRPDSASFDEQDLATGVKEAHALSKRFYVALNSLLFPADIGTLQQWLTRTADIPFDAMVLSDPGALRAVRAVRPEMPIHISTQASTANPGAAAFWREAGANRVILARECTLADAAMISSGDPIEVEIFVHGAMCMAVSGRCLLSAHLCGSSASAGKCKHTCRWEWQLVEQKRPGEALPVFETGRETIFLGSTDLCLIDHIPELVRSGIASLKIEGRMKGEAYVATVTRAYRLAVDAFAADPDGYATDPRWRSELEAISHRPYSTGFAFSQRPDTSVQTMNRPVSESEVAGIVMDAPSPTQAVDVKTPFSAGEELEWIAPGKKTGLTRVGEIVGPDGEERERSHCGTRVRTSFSPSALPLYSILRRRIRDLPPQQ